MYKLLFSLKRDFNDDIIFICNNELECENHLRTLGFSNIKFDDTKTIHGTCSLSDMYGRMTAECFYVKSLN